MIVIFGEVLSQSFPASLFRVWLTAEIQFLLSSPWRSSIIKPLIIKYYRKWKWHVILQLLIIVIIKKWLLITSTWRRSLIIYHIISYQRDRMQSIDYSIAIQNCLPSGWQFSLHCPSFWNFFFAIYLHKKCQIIHRNDAFYNRSIAAKDNAGEKFSIIRINYWNCFHSANFFIFVFIFRNLFRQMNNSRSLVSFKGCSDTEGWRQTSLNIFIHLIWNILLQNFSSSRFISFLIKFK